MSTLLIPQPQSAPTNTESTSNSEALKSSSLAVTAGVPPRTSATRSHTAPVTAEKDQRLIELMKSIYQAEHQVKFLHLQAEAETLLLQMRLRQHQN